MAGFITRLVTGLLIYAIGLFLCPFVVLGLFIAILTKGPKGFWSCFETKDHSEFPAVAKNPKFRHDFVRTRSGLKFQYVHSGSRSNPLMLCLHGFPECWYSYHHILDHFSDKYHVVAVHLRGYGDSDKPKSIGKYHLHYLVNDVKEIVDALGYEKATLVGHDWGGVIGWQVPHYFPEVIDKLIIFNAPHIVGWSHFAKQYPSQLLKSWYIFMFQIPFLPELFIKMDDFKAFGEVFSRPICGDPDKKPLLSMEEIDLYKHCAGKNITYPLNYYRAMNPLYTGMGFRVKTKKIHQPVLFIFGKKDEALDYRMVPFMEKYCDDVTSHLVEHASHWVMLDQPEAVEKLMEGFLQAKTS